MGVELCPKCGKTGENGTIFWDDPKTTELFLSGIAPGIDQT
jgi:hypothetical protein